MKRKNEPFLFEGMTEPEIPVITAPEENGATDYMEKADRMAFDIMETLDCLFARNVTVSRYDEGQKRVKKIITEALHEKVSNPVNTHGRSLVVVHNNNE